MARDQECVVCGKARFLMDEPIYCFSPLICSLECGKEGGIAVFPGTVRSFCPEHERGECDCSYTKLVFWMDYFPYDGG
jgi:hypothetical protein